jgi:hypothetical protein
LAGDTPEGSERLMLVLTFIPAAASLLFTIVAFMLPSR